MKRNLMPTIGAAMGLILIMWAITSSGDIVNFIDLSSIVITLFGSFCALMISFPFKTLRNIPNTLKILVLTPKDDRIRLVSLFSDLSKKLE